SVTPPGRGGDGADPLPAWAPRAGKLLRRFAVPTDSAPGDRRDHGRQVAALAVSPDGRMLATAEGPPGSADVQLYETASGRMIKGLNGHSRLVNDLAFTRDGRRLGPVREDQTGLVWDVTPRALGGKAARAGLAEAWDRLAAPDPALGYAGVAALAAAPAEAVRLLRARLRPPAVPDGRWSEP